MSIRHFEIRAPRPDFTGKLGTTAFADGVARVSFDDTRDEDGLALADEQGVSPGRAAVMFARRRKGYVVVELGEDGKPLADGTEPEPEVDEQGKPAAKVPAIAKGAGK